MASDPTWLFDQAPNVAAFTLKRILSGNSSILVVRHDIEDDSWQFLDGAPMTMADALLVGMGEIVKFDCTVMEVARIPPGFSAYRTSIGKDWDIREEVV